MKLLEITSFVALSLMSAACGDSSASGGSGASSSTTGGAGGDGGGNPASECEEPGDAQGDLAAAQGTPEALACEACLDCAFASDGPCEDFLTPFLMEPGCFATSGTDTTNWAVCVFGDFQEPQMVTGCSSVPEAEFVACLDECNATYPNCEQLYVAYYSCGVCGQCPLGCDGEDVDADGPNCLPVE